MSAAAPESAAVTPGQAALSDAAVQAAAEILFRDYESQYTADHLTWRDFADLAGKALTAAQAAIAARQPQPAPGGEVERLNARIAELAEALTEAARHVEPVDQNSELAIGGWLELATQSTAQIAQYPEQPAPELAAAFPAAKASLARVLSWFGGHPGSSYREATATRAQLASAYQDGELDVPEELRRFL